MDALKKNYAFNPPINRFINKNGYEPKADGSCFPSKKTMRIFYPVYKPNKWSAVTPDRPVVAPPNLMYLNK